MQEFELTIMTFDIPVTGTEATYHYCIALPITWTPLAVANPESSASLSTSGIVIVLDGRFVSLAVVYSGWIWTERCALWGCSHAAQQFAVSLSRESKQSHFLTKHLRTMVDEYWKKFSLLCIAKWCKASFTEIFTRARRCSLDCITFVLLHHTNWTVCMYIHPSEK